jgi:hypothetical protein
MGKPRLFVLPFPLALDAVVLGSLTKNPEHPHQGFFDLAKLPPDVRPQLAAPTEVVNFSSMADSSKRADLEVVLTKFASVFFESGEKSMDRLMACKATEYVVLDSDGWYDTLCGSEPARLWLEKAFVAGSQSVYLITGYRTLVEARLHQERANDMAVGGNVAVPIGQIVADPSNTLDVGVRGGHQSSDTSNRAFTVPGEKIFAVQYRKVKIKWYKRDVESSFLERNNRWVEMFSMRSGSSDLDEDTIYEASLVDEKDNDIPNGCEASDSSEDPYYFKKVTSS